MVLDASRVVSLERKELVTLGKRHEEASGVQGVLCFLTWVCTVCVELLVLDLCDSYIFLYKCHTSEGTPVM